MGVSVSVGVGVGVDKREKERNWHSAGVREKSIDPSGNSQAIAALHCMLCVRESGWSQEKVDEYD